MQPNGQLKDKIFRYKHVHNPKCKHPRKHNISIPHLTCGPIQLRLNHGHQHIHHKPILPMRKRLQIHIKNKPNPNKTTIRITLTL